MSVQGDPLPTGWVWSSGNDLFDVIRGVSYAKQEARREPFGGAIAILRAGNISNGRIGLEDLVYVPRARVRAEQLVRAGDAVIAMSSGSASAVGKAAVAQNDLDSVSFGAFCGLARPLQPELGPWLRYYFQSPEYRVHIADQAAGVNINNLRPDHLRELRIPLPPLTEQRRIVAKLDALLASSRAARAALDAVPTLLEQYRQAVLAAAFRGDLTADWRDTQPSIAREWRNLPWREVGQCQNGRAFPSSEYADVGIHLLRPGNLHVSGRVEWTEKTTQRMPTAWAERFPKHVVGPGEIVMNLTAQSLKDEFLGRVCMTGPTDRCLLNQRIARLTPTAVSPRYAFWVFKSPLFRSYVDGLNTGSLIQHMFTSQVNDFVLPVPSAAEQDEIVRRIEDLLGRRGRLERLTVDSKDYIPPLEAAVLAKAFRGELVPQDPEDEPAEALLARLRAARGGTAPAGRRRRAAARP